jgi:hypothetical protein
MKFKYGKIFLLGFGFFGVSVIWGVYNAFVPIFLADKFHLSPIWIGFFMTLDNIAALFIQPPVGAWSDRLRTKIGRRMPFILIGAPIGAVAFGIIPLAGILPLFVACTSTLILSMAIWRTPVVALMPDITPSGKRSQANGIINFMGGIGTIIALQTGGMLYKLSPSFPFWMGSVLVILAALMVFFFIKEPKNYEVTEKEPNMFASLREVLTDPDKSALRLFLAIFFWFIGYAAVEAFFTLYAKNHLGINEGGRRDASVRPAPFVCHIRHPLWDNCQQDRAAGDHFHRSGIDDCDSHLPVYIPTIYTPFTHNKNAPGRYSTGDRRCAHVDLRRRSIDVRRDRLGFCEHQFASDGSGSDKLGTHRDLYRPLLPVFDILCHCRTKYQWMDHPTDQWKLQQYYAGSPSFYGRRADSHVGRTAG